MGSGREERRTALLRHFGSWLPVISLAKGSIVGKEKG
jgi:hypothetical protein